MQVHGSSACTSQVTSVFFEFRCGSVGPVVRGWEFLQRQARPGFLQSPVRQADPSGLKIKMLKKPDSSCFPDSQFLLLHCIFWYLKAYMPHIDAVYHKSWIMTCCPVRSLCCAFTGAKNLRKVLAAHEVNPLLANSLQGQHQGLLPSPQVSSEKGLAHRHLLKTETLASSQVGLSGCSSFSGT